MSVDSAPAATVVGRLTRQWTSEDRGVVRERFDQTYASICRLATMFGVTPNAVSELVSRMGLRVVRRKRWSPSEEEKLESLLSNHTIDEVVKLTRRSYNSIVVKSKRLGLGKNHRDGWYTQMEVAEILGMSDKTVNTRMQRGQIAFVPHDSSRLPRKGKSAPWHITKDSLVDYIRRYPEELQGRNVDMVLLVDILVGVKIRESR